jgi:23S rRNA (guanine2445-N2)-methyltransferase / 23S rRNA (guanine2069-N7)-methyltransferase
VTTLPAFPELPASPRPLPAPRADAAPRLTARTLEGLEWVLAQELVSIGATDLVVGRRTIEFSAAAGREKETLYRAVLESRTAIRILEPLGRFTASSPESLYAAVQEIDWREQLRSDDTLRVDAAIHDTFLTHSLYAAQVVKDAIVDQLRTPSGRRPSVNLRGATLRVALHLVGDVATVYRDAAGRSLHQRGWRVGEVEAPLSETLAAGILAIAGWQQGEPLLDPFCGSGTLAIEAATIAAGIAPGLLRARRAGHGFFRFRDCDRDLAGRLVAELEARVREPAGSFAASDLDPQAVEAARASAEAAGVGRFITIEKRHFEEARPQSPHGLVVTNPPYGERLPLPRATALMRRIGDWLVRHCGGWRAAILAADTPAAKQLGLRTSGRVPLSNGPIDCKLLEVEIRERPEKSESDRIQSLSESGTREASSESPGVGGRHVSSGRTVDDQIGDFRRRLAKRQRHLAKWARRQGIEAWRVYDRDIPEIPLAIDLYAGWLHAAEYERPHDRTEVEHDVWLDRIVEAAAAELGIAPNRTFLKKRSRTRGISQVEKVAGQKAIVAVKEGGLVFEVNLSDYLDTGLFLDHRTTRSMVRAEAAGKRMLNLFCYTGSFSVYAAAGGAIETTSVDLSNTYLDWTRTNLAANGFKDAGMHRTVRDEARAFLEHRARRGEKPFDLVVVDAPTFSRSAKSETPWDVQQDHATLLAAVRENLSDGGVVYFSTNFRRFKLDEAAVGGLFTVREISHRTIPEDFRNERIHRAWRLVAGERRPAVALAPARP